MLIDASRGARFLSPFTRAGLRLGRPILLVAVLQMLVVGCVGRPAGESHSDKSDRDPEIVFARQSISARSVVYVLQSSGDLRAVQEMLGHASISTTQVYTHLDFQYLSKIYDAAHPRAKKKSQEKT